LQSVIESSKMNKKIIHLKETDSTNLYLRDLRSDESIDMTIVTTDYQTAGRGQGSHTWESEPNKNLLFSVRIHPTMVPVMKQFLLAEAGALALKEALEAYVPEGITMKWPNDIYYLDKKISGTLIETTVTQKGLKSCIFGVGINVNQEKFYSDAPNPISLRNILGHDVSREELFDKIVAAMEKYFCMTFNGGYTDIAALYHQGLYHRTGYHTFKTNDGDMEAELVEVEDDGHLVLHDREGHIVRVER
jgi:BirA family biotin operon repressor/biotin-[acetyl-CoA-carboxylase] ligase